MMEETVNVFFFRLLRLITEEKQTQKSKWPQGLCFHDSVQTVGVLVILLLPYRPVCVWFWFSFNLAHRTEHVITNQSVD